MAALWYRIRRVATHVIQVIKEVLNISMVISPNLPPSFRDALVPRLPSGVERTTNLLARSHWPS